MNKKKINKGKLFRRVFLAILLLGIASFYFADRYVKNHGFEGLKDFISTYRHNKSLAADVEPIQMQLTLKDKDYKFLKEKREEALERGIQINEGDNYVNCEVAVGDETVKAEIRLKGHMTDHLEGDKWSFRVKTDDNEEIMGMYRFSLQNPATRSYANEWVYHELLKKEGIIALNYDFVHLKLNDKDLGIYAVEEHFGQHIPKRNNRPNGAILRWNPELYWDWRIDELNGIYLDEEYSTYHSSFAEPYDKGTVKRDSQLVQTYLFGASMLEAFRRGEKSTSQVFDVDKLAAFHAVIDLIGGHHSLDWSDIKLFYNEKTGLIEPVGYESFSVRESVKIAGQRAPENNDPVFMDYHDQLFSDQVFFKAYIQAIERICSEEYLSEFVSQIQPLLDEKLGVLAHEFPYIKFSFDPYYENIRLIKNNLELPKPLHGFLDSSSDSTITVSVAPVSDFPIEILKVEIDEEMYFLDSAIIIPAKPRNTFANYYSFEHNHTTKKIKNIFIYARIPGSKNEFKVEVLEVPSYQRIDDWFFVRTDSEKTVQSEGVLSFNEKEIILDHTLIIEKDAELRLLPGQVLKFEKNGQIYCEGTLSFFGSEDEREITIIGCEGSNGIFLDKGAKANFQNVVFQKIYGEFMNVQDASANFQACTFGDVEGVFLSALKSRVIFHNCTMGNVNQLAVFDRSDVVIDQLYAKNGKLLAEIFGSEVKIKDSNIGQYDVFANISHLSNVRLWDSSIQAAELIAEVKNASTLSIIGGKLKAPVGIKIYEPTDLPGPSSYRLYKIQKQTLDQESQTIAS